jgi:flagellar motor switch protein FliM
MVNAPPRTAPQTGSPNRRGRERADTGAVIGGAVLGQAKLNPFGDLHTVQHVSARFAKALRGVWEPVLRQEVRTWAEPLTVERFADYRAERSDVLTAWLPLAMVGGTALAVLDGRFVLETLDLFFGGTGAAPAHLPAEFSQSAEALVARLGAAMAAPLAAAWEPLARVDFAVGRVEGSAQGLADADDAMIVTRFGIAAGAQPPVFLDIIYPVSALKPHTASLTGKVLDKAEPDAAWRHQLLRATMAVRFPVRSVLAEPVVPLSLLMTLQVGDVIPISFGPNVPVMVGRDCLGAGTVGTSNGQAAIRLTHLARPDEGSDQ